MILTVDPCSEEQSIGDIMIDKVKKKKTHSFGDVFDSESTPCVSGWIWGNNVLIAAKR